MRAGEFVDLLSSLPREERMEAMSARTKPLSSLRAAQRSSLGKRTEDRHAIASASPKFSKKRYHLNDQKYHLYPKSFKINWNRLQNIPKRPKRSKRYVLYYICIYIRARGGGGSWRRDCILSKIFKNISFFKVLEDVFQAFRQDVRPAVVPPPRAHAYIYIYRYRYKYIILYVFEDFAIDFNRLWRIWDIKNDFFDDFQHL